MDHAALIRPFLSRGARATFTDLDPDTKKRARLLNRLCHDYKSTLDWRIANPIPTAEQTAERIAALLRKAGAERTCYALCAVEQWDGHQAPIGEALRELVGNGLPVLLVCVPDSLAYFEPEYEGGAGCRFILRRPRKS